MKKLSIIIPCYNEEKNIEELLKRVNNVKLEDIEKEIIVVDDCSKDNSKEILEKNRDIIQKILCHKKNRGKGAAVRTGITNSTGDYIIIQDADLEYTPKDYCDLLKPLLNNECDVVYGNRFKNKKYDKGYLASRIANRFFTKFSNYFTHYKLTDVETGYKVFNGDIIRNIKLSENGFGFDTELTAKLSKAEAKIIEVPIQYSPRTKKEGKKIGIKDGIRTIYCILKYR